MTSTFQGVAAVEEASPDENAGERASWFQVAPLVVVLLLFFGLPMLVVLAVSFFDFDRTEIIPAFIFDNYADLFRSEVTLRLYASSLKGVVQRSMPNLTVGCVGLMQKRIDHGVFKMRAPPPSDQGVRRSLVPFVCQKRFNGFDQTALYVNHRAVLIKHHRS